MKDFLSGILSFVFVSCGGNPYKIQGDKVVFRQTTKMGLSKRELLGADPATFESLSGFHGRDAEKVYYRWEQIPQAQAESFQSLGQAYGRDKIRVYLRSETLEGAKPNSFKVLDRPYSRDEVRVYYHAKLVSEDAANFEILSTPFARDSHQVYLHAKPVIGADAKTFEALRRGSGYATDHRHAFWFEQILEGASAESFRTLSRHYATDGTRVFHKAKLLPAKAGHFVVLDEEIGKDQDAVFYRGQTIEGAHSESFSLLNSSYASDKYRIYHNGKAIKEADPATFQVHPKVSGQAEDARHRYVNGKALRK